jgi:hypothetical protein
VETEVTAGISRPFSRVHKNCTCHKTGKTNQKDFPQLKHVLSQYNGSYQEDVCELIQKILFHYRYDSAKEFVIPIANTSVCKHIC